MVELAAKIDEGEEKASIFVAKTIVIVEAIVIFYNYTRTTTKASGDITDNPGRICVSLKSISKVYCSQIRLDKTSRYIQWQLCGKYRHQRAIQPYRENRIMLSQSCILSNWSCRDLPWPTEQETRGPPRNGEHEEQTWYSRQWYRAIVLLETPIDD